MDHPLRISRRIAEISQISATDDLINYHPRQKIYINVQLEWTGIRVKQEDAAKKDERFKNINLKIKQMSKRK